MQPALTVADKAILARADPSSVIGSLARFRSVACPPWLSATHRYPDGALPRGKAAFAAVSGNDMLEAIAIRGPLHAIDGWSYLGRAFSALLSGQIHAARHLSYYAELRAALSILASAGIGVFNRRNAVIDSAGNAHIMSCRGTHDMAWLALAEWSVSTSSMEKLIKPISVAGVSLLDVFREFFPAQSLTAASQLMIDWGFDLEQGMTDRDQRNWSSYQPTALGPMRTTPAQDAQFLRMFWNACRPSGLELERHLLRILLEGEARSHNLDIVNYAREYDNLIGSVKGVVSLDFLQRVVDPVDHSFLIEVASKGLPASPYSMMCRAGLLLRLATGMAEDNLRSAGVDPTAHFSNWWNEFGVDHSLWAPGAPLASTEELWGDIALALEDSDAAPMGYRREWMSALGENAMLLCQTERVALWGLFR